MSKYQPLAEYLRTLDTDSVTLTFRRIEGIIDAMLPPVARTTRQWWANNDLNHPQAQAWLSEGWKTGYVNMSGETVPFHRETG